MLFDNDCGICRWLAERVRERLASKGFLLVPLQEEWVPGVFGMSAADVQTDFRLLEINGNKRQGADVYRYLLKQFWFGYPIYLISILPILNWLFDLCYSWFRDNRARFSKACKI